MKKFLLVYSLIFIFTQVYSQKKFKTIINIDNTSVKNQQHTGTCWSFATSSFLESEVLRIKNKYVDLSEMYAVRNIYEDKAHNYFLRQGKTNFSEGGLSHDYIRSMHFYGVVPQSVYPGNPKGETIYNHTELAKILTAYVKAAVSSRLHTDYWFEGYAAVLDVYFGKKPTSFIYDNQQFDPVSFRDYIGLKASDYIEFTSFTHHPFHKYFVLEIPDNYSSGMYYNLTLEELKHQTDYALENGYSISWDGDVSEPGFDRQTGVIDIVNMDELPDINNVEYLSQLRQKGFEQLSTTDDHLMHIVGKAIDEQGIEFYIIKNSWGNTGDYNGYFYMSEKYFLMKTISIMIHKDVVLKELKPSFFLQEVIFD